MYKIIYEVSITDLELSTIILTGVTEEDMLSLLSLANNYGCKVEITKVDLNKEE